MIINSKIVVRQHLYPLILTRTKTLCIYKTIKVVIVDEDKDLVFTTFLVVPSSFESFNNSQKLTVMSFVLNLYKNHFFRKVGY